MKIIIEVPDSESAAVAEFMSLLPKKKAETIQLTVGQFTQVEIKFDSLGVLRSTTPRRAKPEADIGLMVEGLRKGKK